MEPANASRPAVPLAELNITPLIDVMLVLLIIFMVAVPTLSRTLQLQWPEPQPDIVPSDVLEPVRLNVAVDGRIQFDGHHVDRRQLDYLLRSSAARVPQPRVHIAVADGARYQRVAELMAATRSAGLDRISLGTSP